MVTLLTRVPAEKALPYLTQSNLATVPAPVRFLSGQAASFSLLHRFS